MWKQLANVILNYKWWFLAIIFLITVYMANQARQAKLSYTFTNNIPSDTKVYKDFMLFRELFGNDGNTIVLGFQKPNAFTPEFMLRYNEFDKKLESIPGVTSALSVIDAFNLVAKDSAGNKAIVAEPLVPNLNDPIALQNSFEILNKNQFYKGLIYNPESQVYLTMLSLDSLYINSDRRIEMVKHIRALCDTFENASSIEIHKSGLPYIRTTMALKVQSEMMFFLWVSLLVTSIILIVFFRSFFLLILSLIYIGCGIIWSMGILHMFGYTITLLTALLPPLVVVISVPNIIYFVNKYHSAYLSGKDKNQSLHYMIERIGVVTLFTNLTAAIGFGVFSITSSQVLHEFGVVAGITILMLFVLALIIIPILLSLLPPPNRRHIAYLTQSWKHTIVNFVSNAVIFNRKIIYISSIVLTILSLWGMSMLTANSYIVDDLPHNDPLYTDLKFFEKEFRGVMPLELIVDTKKSNGATTLGTMKRIDNIGEYLQSLDYIGKPLSIAEGIKFARQAYYDGEPSGYGIPNGFDIAFFAPYLKQSGTGKLKSLTQSFVADSNRYARISVHMKDIGTHAMDKMMNELDSQISQIFDKEKYDVMVTGTSVSFLTGSRFIISSLKESIIYAFIVIFACMFYLFRDWRILLMAIVVNILPLMITAGIMGFMHIRLKPSTVLIFSIVLGITVDVTIRFLVNFKQEIEDHPNLNFKQAILATISETGVSIIFTSLVLIFGFGVFALSSFEGTQAIGILIPITLFNAMMFNLTLLPALLMWLRNRQMRKILFGKIGDKDKIHGGHR